MPPRQRPIRGRAALVLPGLYLMLVGLIWVHYLWIWYTSRGDWYWFNGDKAMLVYLPALPWAITVSQWCEHWFRMSDARGHEIEHALTTVIPLVVGYSVNTFVAFVIGGAIDLWVHRPWENDRRENGERN